MRKRATRSGHSPLNVLFAKMDPVAMAISLGMVFSLGLFFATIILLIKGAPPGIPVGPNLEKLSDYLPGYSLGWTGSLVGAIYGSLIGVVIGWALAILWNLSHYLYLTRVLFHLNIFDD